MNEKNNEKWTSGKQNQETKNLEKEYQRDHFPEKSYEDDLDETDAAERIQEEIRHSNHRF